MNRQHESGFTSRNDRVAVGVADHDPGLIRAAGDDLDAGTLEMGVERRHVVDSEDEARLVAS
ncbi:MAG TPA: hypothetical protein VIY28_12600 [Pseudonocardiaceae bacterium]